MLSKDSIQFLDDLKANNNRDWFLDNKKRYEIFKKDYYQLVADFLNAMKPLDPSLEMLEVKNCTFRINRDIRFSKDKSPYKDHIGVWLSSGAKGKNRSGYYVHIARSGSFIAGGFYCPEAEDLKKVRKEIAYFHEDLDEILREKNFKKEFGDFDRNEENVLKNPPRGYEKDHPAIELLKLKSFETSQKFNIEEVTKEDFVSKMTKKLIVLKPLNDFINRALTSEE
ncbi:MAG TPA: TIGR02453 family protein, partial [Flavobacterium sp.]|nr:TIGR02453 family protein [Flavobacterium sp.]HAT77690.1 TIGR02453 family protein [Flavobacterium sp.]